MRLAEGRAEEAQRLFAEGVGLVERTGYRALTADLSQTFARFLLRQDRGAEARPLLAKARAILADPLAHRRRAEIDALIRQCDEVGARQ